MKHKASVTGTLSMISGHLSGLAAGLEWHMTDENREPFTRMKACLLEDSLKLKKIVDDMIDE